MRPRINVTPVSPGALKAMPGLGNYLRRCGLDAKLLDSTINCLPPERINQ